MVINNAGSTVIVSDNMDLVIDGELYSGNSVSFSLTGGSRETLFPGETGEVQVKWTKAPSRVQLVLENGLTQFITDIAIIS